MAVYDHLFSSLVLDGHQVTGWADAADALQINSNGDIGTLTQGIGGEVFVSTNKDGAVLVLNLLQGGATNQFLNARLASQKNLKSHIKMNGIYKDTVNGDTITLIGGWFITKPNFVRGNAQNNMQWTITFVKEERILTKGID